MRVKDCLENLVWTEPIPISLVAPETASPLSMGETAEEMVLECKTRIVEAKTAMELVELAAAAAKKEIVPTLPVFDQVLMVMAERLGLLKQVAQESSTASPPT